MPDQTLDSYAQGLYDKVVALRKEVENLRTAYLNADQFTKFLAGEMPRWAKAVKQAGAKLD